MNKEYLRLSKLLKSKQLTKIEFNLLVTKINYQTWFDRLIFWIFNPYASLSSANALIIGLLLMIFSCFLANMTGFYFPGIPGGEEVFKTPHYLSFLQIFVGQISQWLILSIIFYVIAKINKALNIRLLDFLAFVAMSYLARAFFSLELFTLKLVAPNFFVKSGDIPQLIRYYPKILVSVWNINQWLMYIWIYRLYFASLELASGLSKVRLWINFIVGMVITQSIWYNLSKYCLSF